MTSNPTTVRSGSRLTLAVELLASRKISELPVVDERRVPLGIIDITDLASSGLMQREHEQDDVSAPFRIVGRQRRTA